MQDVKDAARLFRVYFKAARTGGAAGANPNDDYLVDHTIFYYLMDPEGKYVTHFGRDHRPSEVANGIIEAMQAYKQHINSGSKK
jgi:protein SCO1/2